MQENSAAVPFLTRPAALDGSMVGDVGFDPLGFTEKYDIKWLREAELKHGRVCMLASLGCLVQEFVHLPYEATVRPSQFPSPLLSPFLPSPSPQRLPSSLSPLPSPLPPPPIFMACCPKEMQRTDCALSCVFRSRTPSLRRPSSRLPRAASGRSSPSSVSSSTSPTTLTCLVSNHPPPISSRLSKTNPSDG
jgi:hypothetical protein